MTKQVKTTKYFSAKRVATLALLCSLSLVAFLIENLFPPLFVPGAKMGVANVFSLICLFTLGPIDATVVVLVRTVLGSIFGGNVSTILYSTTAGLASIAVSGALAQFVYPKISVVAISVVSAVVHNAVQNVVFCVVTGTVQMFVYLPWLALLGVVAGVVVGFAVYVILKTIPSKLWQSICAFGQN